MSTDQTTKEASHLRVWNIGGIAETELNIPPGVTALVGRNATNRTSLLQAIMATCGSEHVSLKGDADDGAVELTINDTTYTRTLTRHNGTITTTGDPYLDEPILADLFAFLLETNETRRAVEQGDDLRDLIMRPIDTEAIQHEIESLETERREIQHELDELDELSEQLPNLEQRRTQLDDRIANKRDKRDTKQAELDAADQAVEDSRDSNGAITDQLLGDDSVLCWTCGSEVEQEAIDSERIATLIDYVSEYADYVIAALLPEDATALNDDYQRITEIQTVKYFINIILVFHGSYSSVAPS